MSSRPIFALKFVGSVSLGLLTGVSYTLSTIALPSLTTLPSASSASHAFTHLTARALTDERIYAGLSISSFVLAFLFSPRGARHPYLLWTSLLVGISGLTDLALRPASTKTIGAAREAEQTRKGTAAAKASRQRNMEASYEVLGDSQSEGTASASEEDVEEVNGEEVRRGMEGFRFSQGVRTGLTGLAFAMSVVGIWGDGY